MKYLILLFLVNVPFQLNAQCDKFTLDTLNSTADKKFRSISNETSFDHDKMGIQFMSMSFSGILTYNSYTMALAFFSSENKQNPSGVLINFDDGEQLDWPSAQIEVMEIPQLINHSDSVTEITSMYYYTTDIKLDTEQIKKMSSVKIKNIMFHTIIVDLKAAETSFILEHIGCLIK